MQLMVCAFLARRYGERARVEEAAAKQPVVAMTEATRS
jgi:hypothetical protein